MQSGFSATIICDSAMIRQAIQQSFEQQGIRIARSCARCDLGCQDETVDVAVVVSGFCGDPADIKCLKGVAATPARSWILLTKDRHDPIAVTLSRSGLRMCMVPDDIGGTELAHVAALVASGGDLAYGRFAQRCTAEEMQRINDAGLDAVQRQLLAMLADGHTNKSIARMEDTTEASIKARIRSLLQRLGLGNRTQAAVLAARAGLRMEHAERERSAA